MTKLYHAVMDNRHTAAWDFFCDACDNSLGRTLALEGFFCLERVICALDQRYWDRLLTLTGVRDFMPTNRRNEWRKNINDWRKATPKNFNDMKPVTFSEDSAFATAKSLTEEKKDYFAQMVEGVFNNLSVTHKTNKA
ncbi:DUF4942 domain-containing protein [Photorhabdus luminescens]|nr:DUF4942 domain-containing protein [Photorhabdus luminescens]